MFVCLIVLIMFIVFLIIIYRHDLSILINICYHFPASMASSKSKAKLESDVTPAGEETLDFDDDTLKGEDSC